jgi:hypothetical protein
MMQETIGDMGAKYHVTFLSPVRSVGNKHAPILLTCFDCETLMLNIWLNAPVVVGPLAGGS